ncbi:Dual specificity phosphatase, catalytic domain protein [Cordyceps fumosorosea ARSEF 2679]|uniref:protein-tyrosine-phosphatase n=1 Tax=Cordyceps fumosorosea (strain ARSEF 2679) TaxID=1081104 RepID=A0A162MBM7_CORFA|nr:Dual specificity phosphatase, catalytic domain protein [Cordyceps fumosorosea ARSEF 2679]OAA53880.1 Dual specificity phosphatase, catalytic domain protein [Cordyceps fumosorosea ARSEF 2679]
MPSAAARRLYEDQIPTFMSVFDLDADTMGDCDTVTVLEPKLVGMDSKTVLAAPAQDGAIHQDPNHKHSDSSLTQMSESADSSPTTTLSTTDSSPLTDRSPSSSPDSPVNSNLIPLSNYPSTTFGALPVTNTTAVFPAGDATALSRPMTSPAPRRPRNMKGLSILPPLAVTTMAAKAPAPEPVSPCFIKPQIPAMKRKPSQLSLRTNTNDLMRPVLEVPPSPAMPPILQRRALKHSTSTPHMLSMIKTSQAPSLLPPLPSSRMLERNESGLSEFLRPMKTGMRASFDAAIAEEDSPIKPQMANRQDFEPYDESINNEDQKSPTYPDGPIAIYQDNVYLYLEPTAEEAAKFDVVFNVAREVENPFEALKRKSADELARQIQPDDSPIPDTAVTTASFATAFEFQPNDGNIETPTTPKANPLKTPEYIHIPWDHNTDIAPDLMDLCESIQGHTKQGKKVLIHCQQGASRSASLIIAYGLYLNPDLSVNDAYYAAQAKSRWISPNMKLMYSLQDFQKELSKKRPAPTSSAFRPRTGRSPNKHRLTLSADAIDVSPKEPLSAPLPSEEERSREEMLKDGSKRARGNSSPGLQDVSPGPASAPLTFSWKNMEPFASVEKEDAKDVDMPLPPIPTITAPLPCIPPMPTEAPPPIPARAPLRLSQVPPRPKSGMSRPEPSSNKDAVSWLDSLQPPVPRPRSSVGMRALPLRSYQDQMPSTLDARASSTTQSINLPTTPYEEPPLLSPRAETMTNHRQEYNRFPGFTGMQPMDAVVAAAAPPVEDGLFSPRATTFPPEATIFFGRRDLMVDPRSPPTRGEAPIIRSIDDFL